MAVKLLGISGCQQVPERVQHWGGSVKSPKALQQFRRGEGEIEELLLVDGGDEGLVDWREVGFFLSEIRVEVVDVLRRFLRGVGKKKEFNIRLFWP